MAYNNKKEYFKSIETLKLEIRHHFQPLELADLINLNKTEDVEQIDAILDKLESFVEKNAVGVTPSQLRKVYDKIASANEWEEVAINRPEFAYLIAKQPHEFTKKFMLLIDELAKIAASNDKLLGFQEFMRDLIAYHKFYAYLSNRRKKSTEMLKQLKQEVSISKLIDIHTLDTADTVEVLRQLETFIKKHGASLTSTQIRRLFDQVKSGKDLKTIRRCKPLFAYAAARQERDAAAFFMLLVMEVIRQLPNEQESVAQFLKTMEYVVSYHKYEEVLRSWERAKTTPKAIQEEALRYFDEGITPKDLVRGTLASYRKRQNQLRKFIYDNLEGVNSAQIRRIYDATQKAKHSENPVKELKLLIPFYKYVVARQNNRKSKRLFLLLIEMLEVIRIDGKREKQMNDVDSYFHFLQDIVEYHNYFEASIDQEYLKTTNL